MDNKQLLDFVLENFIPMDKIFPPVADFHSANSYATFGEDFKHAYYNSPSLYKELRGKGKGTGLAIAYGGSEYTVSENLNISLPEADQIVRRFNAGLPTFTKFARTTIMQAKQDFFVKDIFGRMRYLPNIIPKKSGVWEKDKMMGKVAKKSERLAINAPIQMSGATQVKLITINVGKYIESNNMHATYGNNVTRTFTKHIVSIPNTMMSGDIERLLDQCVDGNIRVVFLNSDGNVTHYYPILLRLTMNQIKNINATIVI